MKSAPRPGAQRPAPKLHGGGAAPSAARCGAGPAAGGRAGGRPAAPPASHKGEWFSPEHHPAPDSSTTGGRARGGGSRKRMSYWNQF